MSFILDALKKSDQKRQVNATPGLNTVHAAPPVSKPRSKRWLWLGLALLVFLPVGGLFFWLGVSTQQSAPAPVLESKPEQTRVQIEPQLKEQRITRPAASVPPQAEAKPVAKPKAFTPPPQSEPPGREEPNVETSAASTPGRIYAITELPAAYRSRLPEMHMSLHAFRPNNPAASLVRINDRIMRQGAELAGRYLLEEITAEGVVFSSQGYRFLLPR